MEDAIRRIIRKVIEEPQLKSVIEEELKQHYDGRERSGGSSFQGKEKINIDIDAQISFADYPELKMASYQAQALYLFYLLAPYGVANAQLVLYEETLIKIYKAVCRYKMGDDYRAQSVIKGMLYRKGGISDATNKIRKALKAMIKDPAELDRYIIQGDRKSDRFIKLPKAHIKIESNNINNIINELKTKKR